MQQSVLRETDTRATSLSPDTVSQSTMILFPPTDHSKDDGTPPLKDRYPHPFALDGPFQERQSVLRKTDNHATFPSPDKASQSTALLLPLTDHSGENRAPPSTSLSPDTVSQSTMILFPPTDHSKDDGTPPLKDRYPQPFTLDGSF